jgi:hypothetical protein
MSRHCCEHLGRTREAETLLLCSDVIVPQPDIASKPHASQVELDSLEQALQRARRLRAGARPDK